MKKKIIICVAVFLILLTFGGIAIRAMGTNIFDNALSYNMRIKMDFEGDRVGKINFKPDNSFRDNTSCYLTEDKFIYSVFDQNSNNTFGGASSLVIYDLNTGKADYPIDSQKKHLSDIDNLYLLDNELLFTAYAYTDYYEDANRGFCLFSLNINTYELKTIFQTPNTVYEIMPCVIDNALYYFANTMTLAEHEKEIDMSEKYSDFDFHKNQLRCYKNGTDTIIKSGLPCSYDGCRLYADENIYLFADDIIAYNIKGEQIEVSEEKADEIEKMYNSVYYNGPENNSVIATFGDYEIMLSDIKKFSEGDCGFSYRCRYNLNDKKNNKSYKLSEGVEWYYYI